jgi:hypothetical protein
MRLLLSAARADNAQHYNQQIVLWALEFSIIRTETQYYYSNDDTNGQGEEQEPWNI